MTGSEPRLLLVGDENLGVEGLRALLEMRCFSVVATALFGSSVGRQIHRHRPNIVVIDTNRSQSDGIHLTRTIRMHYPQTRIVVLVSRVNAIYMREMFASGANGYLSREIDGNELENALRSVHREGMVIPPNAASQIVHMLTRGDNHSNGALSTLTSREQTIFTMLAAEHDTTSIAKALGVSPKTVRNHLSHIYTKLGTMNRLQTTLYAKRLHADGVVVA